MTSIIKLATYLNKKWADYLPDEDRDKETPIEVPKPKETEYLSPEVPSEAITPPGGVPQEERTIADVLKYGLSKLRLQFESDYVNFKKNPAVYNSIPNYILEAFGKLWKMVVNAQFSEEFPRITAMKFIKEVSDAARYGVELQDRTVQLDEITAIINRALWRNLDFSEEKFTNQQTSSLLSEPKIRSINEMFILTQELSKFFR